ncbi:TLD-domain-containing protein [Gymnopilus junonius]|uniref:Oxidation resistance protein 1 n=1 Tax=Gymnopilus junonius TaxID=109634 RepID=A0A9P5NLH2_GYMJU|nr:TLD-domain-containing protein [Gymnopilus junonius]
MTDVSHKSPFDDVAFLDPLQSQPAIQTATLTPTALTPTPSQYPVSNAHEQQPSYLGPSFQSLSTNKAPSTPASKSKQNADTFASLVADQEHSLFDQASRLNSHTNASPLPHRRTESISSQQSDFGAFVSVPSSEDPLSADLWDFDEQQPQLPVAETPTTATPAGFDQARQAVADDDDHNPGTHSQPVSALLPPPRPSSQSSSSVSINTFSSSSQNNSTLSFFDQFAQNAKERSQARSSHLLDELFLHQDDPLYFVKDQKPADKPDEKPNELGSATAPPAILPPSLLSPPLIPLPTSTLPSPLASPGAIASSAPVLSPSLAVVSPQPQQKHPHSLLDVDLNDELDHDYFRVSQSDAHVPHKQFTLSPHLRSPPTRSSSISVPVPTVAPPVASSEGAVSSQPHSPPAAVSYVVSHHLATSPLASSAVDHPHLNNHHTNGSEDGGIPKLTSRSSFNLPGKWMSTLLRSAPSPGDVAAKILPASPSIESVFGAGSRTAGEISTSPSSSTSPLPQVSVSAMTSPLPSQEPTLHRRSSTSPSRRRIPRQPSFTHSNPFTPPAPTASVVHGASPFAPHVYIPPTGAPGFKGEQYTWDKGYSEELEAEREKELGGKDVKPGPQVNVKAQTLPVVGKENEPEDGAGRGSSALGSKAGWGSGFGFSFGTIRGGGNGKGKLAASGSGSGLRPSNSFISSNGSVKAPSIHSAGSGSDSSSFIANERGVSSPPEMKHSEELTSERTGRKRRDESESENIGSERDGIGAFIERKSGNIELVGRRAATTPVVTSELANMIRSYLPALSRLPRSWTLIYSLDQDGISLNTLYTRCEAHATRRPAPGEVLSNNTAMLVAVRDADGGIFGAWVAEGVRLNKGKGYFGGGESFLWKYRDGVLKVFKCTGKNNYIALCVPESISFGGGDGHYGLYLDESLFDGSSAPCPTFNNEPLCSPGPRKGASVAFECVGLEVWGMGP